MPAVIHHPTALADQIRAANAEARTTLKHSTAAFGGSVHTLPGAPLWIRRHAAALLDAVALGTATVCPHLGPAPRVAVAAVWAPGRLVCRACSPLLTPTNGVDDHTCDRCDRYVTSIHPGAITLGPLVLAYGLCCPCLDATGLNPAGEPHQECE